MLHICPDKVRAGLDRHTPLDSVAMIDSSIILYMEAKHGRFRVARD